MNDSHNQFITGHEHWAADPRGGLMISSDGGSTKLALFEGQPQETRATAAFHLVAFRVTAAGFMDFLGRLADLHLKDHTGTSQTHHAVATYRGPLAAGAV